MRYDPKVDPSQGIGSFLRRARNAMSSAAMSRNLSATRKTRMLKTFSLKEVSEHTGLSRRNIERIRRDYPHAPQGEAKGREVQFTADDIMRLRIYAEIHPEVNQKAIFWREKGSQLPVIVAGSQKGGSAKSLTSCNLALYIQLAYGLRVSIIDADPQATASLYFADDTIDVGSIETQTFTNFMGMQDPGDPILVHDAEKLDTFWKPSPWPGIRILPGGPSIQEGDINLFFLFKQQQPDLPMFHELLKSALKRYDDTYQPRTKPADLVDENGAIIEDRYQAAMTECIDVVIIDCAPVLSMTMLNTIVAGTSLIVPSPLKGFDLNTTRAYTSSAAELISYLEDEQGLVFDKNSSFILPTIVSQQNMTDLSILKGMMDEAPDIVCPVFYGRSEAVANAAEHFQSLYEYVPPKNKRRSADRFLENANAVNDAIVSRCLPALPSRGLANKFIKETYGGLVGPWNEENTHGQ